MAGIDRLKELRGGDEVRRMRTRSLSPTSVCPSADLSPLALVFFLFQEDGETGGEETTGQHSGGADIAAHMAKYEPIKKALTIIEANVVDVNTLKGKNKTTANEKARKEVMQQLEKIMDSTNKNGTLIKKQLDAIKIENEAYKKSEGDSAKSQMRTNLYQTHIRRFHSVMNDYNAAAHAFKQDLQARTRREIKIVDKDLGDEEIDKIIESGKAQDVIKEALISDNLKNVVQVIEERHLDILKLEHQVLEIYELFRDLATLVDLQQESLDVIENRILKARDYTEKAEVELNEAEEYQKKARARRCCLLVILLAVLVAILAPTLLKTVGNA
jgi:t-SNARE complex subunit (syntaxin)